VDRAISLSRCRSADLLLPLALAASCLIAFFQPYDALFDWLTVGQPWLRVAAMLLCWLAGLRLLAANRFSLGVIGTSRPLLLIASASVAVALWCIALDGLIFRAELAPSYGAFEQTPLTVRLLYYATRAINENVLYRLFLGSLLAWVLHRLFRRPNPSLGLAMIGMSLAHLLNVAVNVGMWADGPVSAAWLVLRFVVPGLAWSWMYIRHGFAANEGSAIGVHLVLQPVVSTVF